MPISLVRRGHSVDASDVDAVRDWLMARVRDDVRAKGCAHPRIHLVGEGFEETFDLDAMAKQQPGANAGATFQGLRSRRDIERRFVVMNADAVLHDGTHQSFAMLFEEIDGEERRRWWVAMLAFTTDPTTGVVVPADEWQPSDGETSIASRLPPDVLALASPPPGSKSASVLGPGTVQPDIRATFGELAAGGPAPTNATQIAEFAGQLVANDLLTGVVSGNALLRLAGRAWELFILGENQPATLDDMIRYIANERSPAAEGVALVQVAILPTDNPPVPGAFIRAEHSGHAVEMFAPIAFPDGPGGRKVLSRIMSKPVRPLPEDGVWLGVDPLVFFDLGPIGSEA